MWKGSPLVGLDLLELVQLILERFALVDVLGGKTSKLLDLIRLQLWVFRASKALLSFASELLHVRVDLVVNCADSLLLLFLAYTEQNLTCQSR